MKTTLFQSAMAASAAVSSNENIDPIVFGTELASIEALSLDIENDENILDRSTSSLESLDNIISYKGKMATDEKGFDTNGAVMAQIAVESICDNLGYPYESETQPSLEDFTSDSITATTISCEADKNIFKKAWDHIVKFVTNMVAKIKVLVAKVLKQLMFIESRAKKMKEKAKMYKKDGYTAKETEVEAKGMAGKFGVLLNGTNSTTINADLAIASIELSDGGDTSAMLKEMEAIAEKYDGESEVKKAVKSFKDYVKSAFAIIAPTKDSTAVKAGKAFAEAILKDSDYSKEASGVEYITCYGSTGKAIVTIEKDGVKKFKAISGSVEVDADNIKYSVVDLGDVEKISKAVIDGNKRVSKNSGVSTKAFDEMTKLIKKISKDSEKVSKKASEQFSKAAKDASSNMALVSSMSAAVIMNNLKASLAAISYVNNSLDMYEK